MCGRKLEDGQYVKDPDDWWYVEIVQWANVIWFDDNDKEEDIPAVFGCYMEPEEYGGGIDFVEIWDDRHLHYTTEEPAYMDCVDIKDGSGVKKSTRSDKYAPISKEELIAAIDRAKGNKQIAAKLLGIHRATLFNVINRYELRDQYIKPYKKR
jgi:DNA-binding NtrC family response regulator